ncbi:MAG: hypothetical protein J6T88_07365 [Bacteroidales bacterium]|nr:hypothetical protein [Bacteroidales bacterium]
MKKKILSIVCLILIGGLSTLYFASCDKDTNCYVQITVVDEETHLPVQGVFVKIDINSSAVNAEGYTDVLGQYTTSFTAPAIFNVSAEYETGYDETYTQDLFYCYRKGNNTIRLKEGDTVYSTINLESEIHRDYRN